MKTPGLREILRFGKLTQSLRFRATVAVASFLVMISLLLSGLFVVYIERGERDALQRHAEDWSTRLTEAAAEAVRTQDPARLEGVLATVRAEPRILYLEVRGADGPLALWTERCPADLRDRIRAEDASPSPPPPPRRPVILEEATPVLDVLVPVRAPGIPSGDAGGGVPTGPAIGSVRFGLDLTAARQRRLELRGRIAVSTLAMIGLGTLGTMFLVGTIVAPIQELAQATERIAEGDFDVHTGIRSRDEVGVLSRSFDRMAERLRHAQERQRSWSNELADRVREKTREIEETRAHLANIVENVGASILVADLDGTIVSANSHTVHVFGSKPEWMVGRSIDEFTGDAQRRLATLLPMLRGGRGSVTYEARHRLAEGEDMDLLVTFTLLRDPSGEPGGVLQIAKDITPLKDMERRLVTTERLTAMGEMAGEIGHELNNYLMAIGGRAELIPIALRRGADPASLDRVRRSAEIITRQVAEMRALTDGLLESARKESSPADVDLNELVRDTLDFVRPQNRFDLIRFDVAATPGALPVWADAQQIRQVLLNLLTNGADAILAKDPSGGVLRVETWRDAETAGFRVTDDGTGIAPEVQRRMFEPHFTTKDTGHGFGLAVCHRVVANHGGRIAVDSTPGRGTTFEVSLELLRSRRAPDGVATSP